LKNGFHINDFDKCVCVEFTGNKRVTIYSYVDDLLIFGTDLEQVEDTKYFCHKTSI